MRRFRIRCDQQPSWPQVTVVEDPAPLFTPWQLASHVRVDLPEEGESPPDPDGFIADLEAAIAGATASIDGPSGWYGRALAPQTLELSTEGFGQRQISLPFPPIIRVLEVTWRDEAGEDHPLDASAWRAVREQVRFRSGAPDTEDLRIRYRAGYSDGQSPESEKVPRNIKSAIRLMVGDLWRFRETAEDGRMIEVPMSTSVMRLIGATRIWPV